MEEAQNGLDQESNADDVMSSLGVEPESSDSMDESDRSLAKEADPLAIKKRLGMQAKKHQKELRVLREQVAQLQSQVGQQSPANQPSDAMSSYMQQPPTGMSIEEQIQRGVQFALHAKDEQERKLQEAQRMAHVQKQYQRLDTEFDKASDKYDDFDDVVRGDDAPFSTAVRDALLLVDNPAEVAYKLGKNKDELRRISQLHPLDQAREVNKLSFALMGGNGASSAPSGNGVKPMNPIKSNPVNSSANYSASSIRARMKAGNWK